MLHPKPTRSNPLPRGPRHGEVRKMCNMHVWCACVRGGWGAYLVCNQRTQRVTKEGTWHVKHRPDRLDYRCNHSFHVRDRRFCQSGTPSSWCNVMHLACGGEV